MSANDKMPGPRYVPPDQLSKLSQYEGTFSKSAIRHLIFNAKDRVVSDGTIIPGNGLAPAILRVGRRVLIDIPAFEAWLNRHRMTGPGG